MGKHEPLTAKAIGKRIKAKGLQKLKFYCQMCQKQCRDANGFKCHLTSEAHQRQLLLFAENPNRYMDEFSSEFMKDFLHLLKRRYSTKRVLANQVYQEYIKDRDHLHMNSTRWCTLTGFVKWMGRKGICHVENNEKGWYITYIDRDPETLLRNENMAKKEKMFKDDNERQAKLIEEQIERGKKSEMEFRLKNGLPLDEDQDSNSNNNDNQEDHKKIFKKESEDQKITFAINVKKTPTVSNNVPVVSNALNTTKKTENTPKDEDAPTCSKKILPEIKKKSALDEIIEEQERWKTKQLQKVSSNNKSNRINIKPESVTWMIPGIVVRVICKELGKEYFEKKAVIESVEGFTAILQMINSGDLIKVDESHLETVVPGKPGTRVMVLRGLYRSHEGSVVRVTDDDKVLVLVDRSSRSEPIQFNFDDISKLK